MQQWGGIVINGNGITNNCTDAERAGNLCHVVSEGQPSNYGGNNNAESSGSLRYVIVKHTGFEVAPGDELNGITFNAVGSGTVVENIQVYSTYDDGLEFFGGAVNINNAIILYARDDSLDFSDGYAGTVANALVIQWQNDGNRCIELDNIGSARSDAGQPLNTAPLTAPTVSNLTCITSNTDVNTHGDSEGPLVRQGGQMVLDNSIVYAGYGTTVNGVNSNECYDVESAVSFNFAIAGATGPFKVTDTVIACQSPVENRTLPEHGQPDVVGSGRQPERERRQLLVQQRQLPDQRPDQRERARAAARHVLHGGVDRGRGRDDAGRECFHAGSGAAERRLDDAMGLRPARLERRRAAVVCTLT